VDTASAHPASSFSTSLPRLLTSYRRINAKLMATVELPKRRIYILNRMNRDHHVALA
jgi:hypothetical protein